MKRGHALLILLLLPLAVMSQRLVQKGNFFTMWVSGGYSNFMHTMPSIHSHSSAISSSTSLMSASGV